MPAVMYQLLCANIDARARVHWRETILERTLIASAWERSLNGHKLPAAAVIKRYTVYNIGLAPVLMQGDATNAVCRCRRRKQLIDVCVCL